MKTKKSQKTTRPGHSEPVEPDEIPLFDGILDMVTRLEDSRKREIGQILLFVLACAEDGQLNMNKVATLINKMDIGMRFDVPSP